MAAEKVSMGEGGIVYEETEEVALKGKGGSRRDLNKEDGATSDVDYDEDRSEIVVVLRVNGSFELGKDNKAVLLNGP
jgi:hypothetical protein